MWIRFVGLPTENIFCIVPRHRDSPGHDGPACPSRMMVGMHGSGFIVAVSTGPDAPIFQIAEEGAGGESPEVVPHWIEAICEMKGAAKQDE